MCSDANRWKEEDKIKKLPAFLCCQVASHFCTMYPAAQQENFYTKFQLRKLQPGEDPAVYQWDWEQTLLTAEPSLNKHAIRGHLVMPIHKKATESHENQTSRKWPDTKSGHDVICVMLSCGLRPNLWARVHHCRNIDVSKKKKIRSPNWWPWLVTLPIKQQKVEESLAQKDVGCARPTTEDKTHGTHKRKGLQNVRKWRDSVTEQTMFTY